MEALLTRREALLRLGIVGLTVAGVAVAFKSFDDEEDDDVWRPVKRPPFGVHRFTATAATGTAVVFAGGEGASTAGGVLDLATETWVALPRDAVTAGYSHAVAVEGGVMVWGGYLERENTGAFINTATGAWAALPRSPIEPERTGQVIAWTGRELIIWGGESLSFRKQRYFDDGAAYAPATRTWRELPRAPHPPRSYVADVWTGTELFVLGGNAADLDYACAAYSPDANEWRVLAPLSTYFARSAAMIDGAATVVDQDGLVLRYDHRGDTWETLTQSPEDHFALELVAWTSAGLIGLRATGGNDRVMSWSKATAEWTDLGAAPFRTHGHRASSLTAVGNNVVVNFAITERQVTEDNEYDLWRGSGIAAADWTRLVPAPRLRRV